MKPGAFLFAAVLLWAFSGALSFFFEEIFAVWLWTGPALLLLALADALTLFFAADRLAVSRELPSFLALGRRFTAALTLRRRGGILPIRIRLFDLYPPSMDCSVFPARLDRKTLKRFGILNFEYSLIPLERGPWEFPGLQLLLGSPLGFWRLKVFHPVISRGRTYPDFKTIISQALEGVPERTGFRGIRRRGQGMEFQSLRDYQAGDTVRNIDWRATGRRRKLVIREYQEEQDQQVLFLLDSGYRLHRLEAGPENSPGSVRRTQFDGALESAMFLAYIALKHGDSVAAGVFGGEERWLPPRKGMSALTGLMNSLYDLKSAPVPSSPFSILENALNRLHRRTFIILISNFREEDGESLSWILPRIEKRHLLLVVSLREPEVEELCLRRPKNSEEILESAAAFSYRASRRELYKTWEHLGLLTLESTSAALSSSLINRYLQVKRSGRL